MKARKINTYVISFTCAVTNSLITLSKLTFEFVEIFCIRYDKIENLPQMCSTKLTNKLMALIWLNAMNMTGNWYKYMITKF